jgi:pimeloyl-ACP methyl ester carboxylesterase
MDSKFTQPEELNFQIGSSRFAAQAWGNPTHHPILALHGWLDNSASFFALAPLLNDVYIVAIDLAGHGRSGHRPGSFTYNIWEDVAEIFTIADELGWGKFSLLGHSRGAIISVIAAGTFPERIIKLGLLEGFLPEPSCAEDAPKQLARSIKSIQTLSVKALSTYSNIERAIKARERGMFPLSYSAAKALTERGLKKFEGGYRWSTDQRLFAPSAIKLLPEQLDAFIRNISCPIALVLAENGVLKSFPHYNELIKCYTQLELTILPGGHHLHMEQEVNSVAKVLNTFFVDNN